MGSPPPFPTDDPEDQFEIERWGRRIAVVAVGGKRIGTSILKDWCEKAAKWSKRTRSRAIAEGNAAFKAWEICQLEEHHAKGLYRYTGNADRAPAPQVDTVVVAKGGGGTCFYWFFGGRSPPA